MATPDGSDDHHSNGQARGGRGRFTRGLPTAQRDREAAELRTQGHSYHEIAQRLGYKHRESARRAVARALVDAVREPADELRQMELIRLDSLWVEAVKVLHAAHVTVSNGKVVTMTKDGEEVPVADDAPVLQAIDRLLKIMERRSKLLGLDAPTKVEVMSLDRIDQAIAELERELGAGEAGAAEEAPPASPGEG